MKIEEIRESAALHKRCLPNSLIGDLPRWLVDKFYINIAESAELDLVLHRVGGVVVGAAVISKVGFGGSKKALPLLAYATVLIKNPREILTSFFRGSLGVNRSDRLNIEFLFVDSSGQGKGIGGYLVDSIKAQYGEIYVSTRSNSDNRALLFYQKNGFVKNGERLVAGRNFTEFVWRQ